MKERERKEKGSDANPGGKNSNGNGSSEQQAASSSESPMDEIQLFKLMMKREAQKKEDKSQDGQVEYGPPGLSNSSSLQGNAASGESASS